MRRRRGSGLMLGGRLCVRAAAVAVLMHAVAGVEAVGEAGPPRYRTSGPLARVSAGAPVRDDFEAGAIRSQLWRIWHSDPRSVRLEQKDGRFWIHARGTVGYNVLVSRVDMPTRDIVAVCRMGVSSPEGGLHGGIVHVCGSGRWSPDHWFELSLRATSTGAARATIGASIPPEHRGGYRGSYELPPAGPEGFLTKVVCEGATNQCRGFVRVGLEWWQIGDAFEVPARSTHLEIKTMGPDKGGASTAIWFDDCRLYPRPETHYVTVVLQRPDGRHPGDAVGGGDHQVCFDEDNREIPDCEFTVKLYASDGTTLVDETSTGAAFGYALLKLEHAPWELYPAAAVIRVFVGDQQIGPDHVIESQGVEGLYPDDVYTIPLR